MTGALGHDDVTTLHVTLRDGQVPVAALVDRAAAGAQLMAAQVVRPSLEDAFITLTGTSVSDTGEAVRADAR